MLKKFTSIGLMSGTSLDGIDAAIIETDGVTVNKRYKGISALYKNEFKAKIRKAISDSSNVEEVEGELTILHAQIVAELLKRLNLSKDDIDVIGFHGQTISHKPDQAITVQIGDGNLLAKLTGINVVNNFRIRDVESGGQGAPLVPVYHKALVDGKVDLPVAIVNIGGVANITWVGRQGELISFDTGPGNALIDDLIFNSTGKAYDEDGKIASSGSVNLSVLEQLLSHEYFSMKAPKSLDRDAFATGVVSDLSLSDAAATLSEFTAKTIALSAKNFPELPHSVYFTGGGRHNLFIMNRIKEMLAKDNINVMKIEELGYDGDMLEAEAFAFLAVRSLNNLPLTFPSTTGVMQEKHGGVFCQA